MIEEVVPKLGAKAGFPALRIGTVAKYDRPLEHLCGQLDVAPLRLPLRARDGRYGLVLCFSLDDVDPPKLARELVRVTHPDGAIWIVVWKGRQQGPVPRRAGVRDPLRPPAPRPYGLAREPQRPFERRRGVRLLVLALALALAACGGGFASPTPTPQSLTVPELKYRVIDDFGKPWFCDPDFYPIARADEGDLARQRFPELQKDAETFGAIVARLKLTGTTYTADEQLAIYREWKTLNALQLQPTNSVWAFAYLAQKTSDAGERVDGRVSMFGRITVINRAPAGAPPCPICLALGTRIATPHGEVAVEDLRVGDMVWTTGERGERVAAPLITVGSMVVPATHEVVRVALGDGRIVFVSPGHPTADGRRIGDLDAGDTLDGEHITSVERVRYTGGATYDILPAGATGAYWANGIPLGSTLR